MLSLSGVRASYGHIEALRGVDLEVARGEIVALIGANGAGESTLLMTVCGHPQPTSGRVVFDGVDIAGLPTFEIVRRGIAQVPEGRRIFPRMTVLENLQMGAVATGEADLAAELEPAFALFPVLSERRAPPGATLA